MEVKFEKKEMEYVIDNLDQAALDAEIQRVTPIMQAVNQDPASCPRFDIGSPPEGIAQSL